MNSISIKGNAKINLSLNITGVRGNMHTLDMILASVELCDIVTITKSAGNKNTVTYSRLGEFIENDSALRAANLFSERFGCGFVNIFVEKNIPIAGGLGGSGVDAAAALKGIKALFGIENDISKLALEIGSDVPFLLEGGFARVKGIGEELEFFSAQKPFYVVLAKGEGHIQAKDSYQQFDKIYKEKKFMPAENNKIVRYLQGGENLKALPFMENALTMPGINIDSGINYTFNAIRQTNPLKVLLTGSGPVCVGFYNNMLQAEKAAGQLAEKNFWAVATKTV